MIPNIIFNQAMKITLCCATMLFLAGCCRNKDPVTKERPEA